ncbi:MAG: hypothetical protein WAP51_05025, partial [Candidatus Sungiibacteriota bacterium]
GKEQKRDEIRPKAKVQSDTEGINPALKNGVAALRRPLRKESRPRSELLQEINAVVGEPRGVTPFSSDGVNDTKISVSDILKAQKQVIKTPLVAPGASTSSISDADGSPDNGINERQGAIIGYLKANKEARMTDLVTIFSNRFSIKTLQRDLARLITNGEVLRQGDKRWAVYRLNEVTNN